MVQFDQLASEGQSNAESLKSERDWESGRLNANNLFRERYVRVATVYSWFGTRHSSLTSSGIEIARLPPALSNRQTPGRAAPNADQLHSRRPGPQRPAHRSSRHRGRCEARRHRGRRRRCESRVIQLRK
jgi:hypothetical protein